MRSDQLRRIVTGAIQVTVLTLLTGLALEGLRASLAGIGAESTHHLVRRAGPALLVLCVSLAYRRLLFRAGPSLLSTGLHLVSCAGVGVISSGYLSGLVKRFAPATPEEALVSAVSGGVFLLAVVAGVFWAWSVQWRQRNRSLPWLR